MKMFKVVFIERWFGSENQATHQNYFDAECLSDLADQLESYTDKVQRGAPHMTDLTISSVWECIFPEINGSGDFYESARRND